MTTSTIPFSSCLDLPCLTRTVVTTGSWPVHPVLSESIFEPVAAPVGRVWRGFAVSLTLFPVEMMKLLRM
ncbi:MAG: hypothetical protein ABW100_03375 [Candidatus Thiodiazotropha sp. 6PLUC3]